MLWNKSKKQKYRESENRRIYLWKNIACQNSKVYFSIDSDCNYAIKLYRTFQDDLNLFIQM